MTQQATISPEPTAKPAPDAPPEAATPPAGDGVPPGADSGAGKDGKPGEVKAEPVKAKDRAAYHREGHRFRKARDSFKEELDKAKADMKAQLDAVLARNKAAEDKAAQLERERQEYLEDPISYAEKHGRKPDDVVTSYVKKGTPEAKQTDIERGLAEERAKREALEKKIADDEKARAEADKKQQEQRHAAMLDGQCDNFVRAVRAAGKKLPHLNSFYEDSEIKAKAAEIQRVALERGEVLTFDDVSNAFETAAKKAYEKKHGKLSELLTPEEGEPVTDTGVQVKREPGTGRRETADGPPKRSAPKTEQPKLSRRLSRAEQDAADLAMLKAATAKDRAAMKS